MNPRQIKDDLRALVGQSATDKTLPKRPQARPPGAASGAGKPNLAGSQTAGNGGIAGPISEVDAAQRTYHATPINLRNSGGLFTIKVYPPQTFKMQDRLQRPFDWTLDA